MNVPCYTTGQVAHRVSQPRWWLMYLVEKGILPSPSYQVPGRRLFTEEDITKINEFFAQYPEMRKSHHPCEEAQPSNGH